MQQQQQHRYLRPGAVLNPTCCCMQACRLCMLPKPHRLQAADKPRSGCKQHRLLQANCRRPTAAGTERTLLEGVCNLPRVCRLLHNNVRHCLLPLRLLALVSRLLLLLLGLLHLSMLLQLLLHGLLLHDHVAHTAASCCTQGNCQPETQCAGQPGSILGVTEQTYNSSTQSKLSWRDSKTDSKSILPATDGRQPQAHTAGTAARPQ